MMLPRNRPTGIRRTGFTLVEVVVSMAIMVVLLGGMSSAVFIASRAVDDGQAPASITGDAAEVATSIADDLTFALSYRELTSTAITFTVPDRDGNSLPELIRYAWSGIAGDPLTRTYNNGTPVAIVDHVDELAFSHLLRTITPPNQACCQPDGTCLDMAPDACTLAGGTPRGLDSICATTTCPVAPKLLLVVTAVGGETAEELTRKTLIESWGYVVTEIAASSVQADFSAAFAGADVVYVSEAVDGVAVGNKLTGTAIGVVNEHPSLAGNLGFSSGLLSSTSSAVVTILNNTHYITSPLALGDVTLCSSSQSLVIFGAPIASGATTLAQIGINNDTLLVLEAGAILADSSPAAGRRVQLPWGRTGFFAFSTLNANGQTMMQRTIDWAAGQDGAIAGAVCGNGSCEAGEDSCTCPGDCGLPAAFEQPGATCNDGLDNDCDGTTDCNDLNCPTDPACLVTVCGNGTCDAGEDCTSCSADCASVLTGKASGQYCCGNGMLEAAEGDGTICDGNP